MSSEIQIAERWKYWYERESYLGFDLGIFKNCIRELAKAESQAKTLAEALEGIIRATDDAQTDAIRIGHLLPTVSVIEKARAALKEYRDGVKQ